jgi:hypothetical protein
MASGRAGQHDVGYWPVVPAALDPEVSMRRRLTLLATLVVSGVLATLALASPASATTSVTTAQKVQLLNSFTQATTSSQKNWNAARQDQAGYAAYTLNWSTDYCSDSPDEPLGFDFRMPCWRHDFGYRNYKEVGQFPANKAHIDNGFYFDLKAKCATYSVLVRSVCDGLAWTYYEAVHEFGSVSVDQVTLDRFAAQKQVAQAQASHTAQ